MLVVVLGWLLRLIFDRVLHARVSYMCLAFYCFIDKYVFWYKDAMIVCHMHVCVCVSLECKC